MNLIEYQAKLRELDKIKSDRLGAIGFGIFWGIVLVLLMISFVVSVKADCTGCDPGPGFRHLFDSKGNPKIMSPETLTPADQSLTIDPRGTIWFKGKRAEDLNEEELLELVERLLKIIQEKP